MEPLQYEHKELEQLFLIIFITNSINVFPIYSFSDL